MIKKIINQNIIFKYDIIFKDIIKNDANTAFNINPTRRDKYDKINYYNTYSDRIHL